MPYSPSTGSASTRLVGATASFIDFAASVAFSLDSETMCEKPKLTLVSLAVKLHSPCPPDITRQGAPSGKPLFNSATSINGHFAAAAAVPDTASRQRPNRITDFMRHPQLVELAFSPAVKVLQKTGARAFDRVGLMHARTFGFNVTHAGRGIRP